MSPLLLTALCIATVQEPHSPAPPVAGTTWYGEVRGSSGKAGRIAKYVFEANGVLKEYPPSPGEAERALGEGSWTQEGGSLHLKTGKLEFRGPWTGSAFELQVTDSGDSRVLFVMQLIPDIPAASLPLLVGQDGAGFHFRDKHGHWHSVNPSPSLWEPRIALKIAGRTYRFEAKGGMIDGDSSKDTWFDAEMQTFLIDTFGPGGTAITVDGKLVPHQFVSLVGWKGQSSALVFTFELGVTAVSFSSSGRYEILDSTGTAVGSLHLRKGKEATLIWGPGATNAIKAAVISGIEIMGRPRPKRRIPRF